MEKIQVSKAGSSNEDVCSPVPRIQEEKPKRQKSRKGAFMKMSSHELPSPSETFSAGNEEKKQVVSPPIEASVQNVDESPLEQKSTHTLKSPEKATLPRDAALATSSAQQ